MSSCNLKLVRHKLGPYLRPPRDEVTENTIELLAFICAHTVHANTHNCSKPLELFASSWIHLIVRMASQLKTGKSWIQTILCSRNLLLKMRPRRIRVINQHPYHQISPGLVDLMPSSSSERLWVLSAL